MRDAVIVGGGPAGSATAILLARSGREIALIERSLGPSDKVCGEFLSREAAMYLGALGVDLAAHGAAPIDALRLSLGDRVTRASLPFRAWSLSRRALDEALIELAAAGGAEVRRGVRVTALANTAGRARADLANGTTIEAKEAFLATGKHDLRGRRRPAGWQSDLLAFKIYFRPSPKAAEALRGHVELALFQGGYAGVSPIEGDRVNLCLVVQKRRFEAVGQRWDPLFTSILAESPHLASRLEEAEICVPRPLALAAIPYGHVERRSKGIWVLGDQAAVIPSFTGDGLSIALHSAHLAARVYLEGGRREAFQRRLARDVSVPIAIATGLSLALVHGAGQSAIATAARVAPRLLPLVASLTRVPETALVRGLCERPP